MLVRIARWLGSVANALGLPKPFLDTNSQPWRIVFVVERYESMDGTSSNYTYSGA
jgi:hypothetical protein